MGETRGWESRALDTSRTSFAPPGAGRERFATAIHGLRSPPSGIRSTRGYIRAPRWGEESLALFRECLQALLAQNVQQRPLAGSAGNGPPGDRAHESKHNSSTQRWVGGTFGHEPSTHPSSTSRPGEEWCWCAGEDFAALLGEGGEAVG